MVGLTAEHGEEKTVMIDATYLKAHWTATTSVHGLCSAACQMSIGCSGIAATTPTGSEKR